MATIDELIGKLRSQIGDNDPADFYITDDEMTTILTNAASEYSRIKSYIKIDESQTYDKSENIYPLPIDSYKVKEVKLKISNKILNFIDNLDQIILLDEPDVQPETLKITYSRYFSPTQILDKEIDLYLLYAEALCYKLLSTKSAELIKFSTGEKSVDESGISEKYLDLYECTEKKFRSKAIKAYGRRADYKKDKFDYTLAYPPEGESP